MKNCYDCPQMTDCCKTPALPAVRSEPLLAAEQAITAVIQERGRQDSKWGQQNHDAGTWALILLEEIGEWAKAELHARFGGPDAGNAHTEAVHTTAVALAIIECMNRKANGAGEPPARKET